MKTIQSTNGYTILVDDNDYEDIAIHKWYAWKAKRTRYAFLTGDPRVYLHHCIMDVPTGMQVHHINGNGLDCRKENMKIVTSYQNTLHRLRDVPRDPNLTPYTGVYYKSRSGKERDDYVRELPWYCDLKVCGKKYRRMYFRTADEAKMARNEMISQYITVL